jgi:hypothetical protein
MKRLIFPVLLAVVSINGFAQSSEKLMFDQVVLSSVKSAINDQGELEDQERLFLLVANDTKIKAWIQDIVSPSLVALNSAASTFGANMPLPNYALIKQKTRGVFFDRSFFDSIPQPDVLYYEFNNGYSETNASLISDISFFREQVDQVFESAEINSLFDRNKIPGEDDDLTNTMFINPPVNKGTKLIRPLFDQAMVLQKRYTQSFDQLKGVEAMLEKALRSMETLIQDWSLKADYYPLSEEERLSEKARESWEYKISRAILMRLCQEKISQLQVQVWKKKVDNLARLSDQTATVFSVVDWNNSDTKKSDLSNPLIQMAQRALTISSRLDLLIFEAGVIQNQGQLAGKTYQRTLEGAF